MELARYCYLSHINLTHYRQLDEALMAIVPVLLELPAQKDTALLLPIARSTAGSLLQRLKVLPIELALRVR